MRMEVAESGVSRALPQLKTRIEGLRNQPPAYLVQNYLHDNWHPLWCSQVMSELGEAKLDLVASATMAENLLPTILPAALQEMLQAREEHKVREDLIDCLINQTSAATSSCAEPAAAVRATTNGTPSIA